MRKRILWIAALALLSSMVMSTAQAGPIPYLVSYARYFVATELIQHYTMNSQQSAPAIIDDQQLTTPPPMPNPDAQAELLDQGGVVVVNESPVGLRDASEFQARRFARVQRERLRP